MQQLSTLAELQHQFNLQVTELIECDVQIKTLKLDLNFANQKLNELKIMVDSEKNIPEETSTKLIACIQRSFSQEPKTNDDDIVGDEHAHFVHELLEYKKKLSADYDNLVSKNFTAEVQLEERQRKLNSTDEQIAESTMLLEAVKKDVQIRTKSIDTITTEHTVLQNQLDAVQTELNNGMSERTELHEEITRLCTVMLDHQKTVHNLHSQIESLQRELSQKLRNRHTFAQQKNTAVENTDIQTTLDALLHKGAIEPAGQSHPFDPGCCTACNRSMDALEKIEQDILNLVEALEFIINTVMVDIATTLADSRVFDPPIVLLPDVVNGTQKN